MPRMTQAEVNAYNARQGFEQFKPSTGVEKEAELHDAISTECRRRGWYVVHSRMDRQTTTAIGVPDFIIAINEGRVLWVEAKAKAKKLTKEQAGAHAWLVKLGHVPRTVRSLEEFLDIIK